MIKPVKDKAEVAKRICDAKGQILSLGVLRIGLFGSFVAGRQTQKSDVDLLVEFTPDGHTFDNFMDLAFLLDDLLGRHVELVTPESLSPYIGPHILREVKHVFIAA
jgi:predicted nucleotidyltransferase